MIATSDSGASSWIRTDHGGSITARRRNAPRARGPSSSPAKASTSSTLLVDARTWNRAIQPWTVSRRRVDSEACTTNHPPWSSAPAARPAAAWPLAWRRRRELGDARPDGRLCGRGRRGGRRVLRLLDVRDAGAPGPSTARRARRHAVGQPGAPTPSFMVALLARRRPASGSASGRSSTSTSPARGTGSPACAVYLVGDRRDDRLPHPPQQRPGHRRSRRCRGGQPLVRLRRRRGRRGTTSARSRARPPRSCSSSDRAASEYDGSPCRGCERPSASEGAVQ